MPCSHFGCKNQDVKFRSVGGDTKYCRECGETFLVFEDQLGFYIYEEDRRDYYLDDHISDIEIFEKV
jgi:hypothetical protein